MHNPPEYRRCLETIRAHQQAGELDRARPLLDALVAQVRATSQSGDGAAHAMGPLTALGLPRRLHAALLRQAKAERDPVAKAGYQFNLVPPPHLLAQHGQLTTTERCAWNSSNREAVPHHIHQIWIGPKDAPASTAAWREHAQTRGYGYTLWREDELQAAGVYNETVFLDRLERGDYPGAVDVARYVLLERFGGIYLDCDWYPARSDIGFDDLLPLTGLTVMAEDVPRNLGALGSVLFYNSFIAAPAGHPVFRRILDALPQIARDIPGAPAWWATGPLIFTIAARAGAVSLADPSSIAASFPQGTARDDIDAFCMKAPQENAGLLIAWKSWS